MSFKVHAYRKSAITRGESRWELRPVNRGFAFVCVQTGTIEMGTYTEGVNKFEALDAFKKVSGDLPVRFELT